MKSENILLFVLLFSLVNPLIAQVKAPTVEELKDTYSGFKESTITKRHFTVDHLENVLEQFKDSKHLKFRIAAESLEGRPIYFGEFGHGPTPIMYWSQMHGDESTATMALMDFFHWLDADEGNHLDFRDAIADKFTLYFIPMLNPDGAEKFQRRNAANIDLNRDALHLSSPEARLLKTMRDSLEPVVGFNLHDQSVFYRSGVDGEQVAITFLATAFDQERNINGVRLKSMQLISVMHDSLQTEIPGKMATYDDTFEPRAFGDNIQKWGTTLILIESGGYQGDPEKQYLRKLNYILYIKSLESMMKGTYKDKTVKDYESIPVNDRKMISLKIKNLKVPVGKHRVQVGIGYLYREKLVGEYQLNAYINDVGDLRVYTAFEEFDAEGMELVQAQWHKKPIKSIKDLKSRKYKKLIREGNLGFILKKEGKVKSDLPLHLAAEIPGEKDFNPFDFDFRPGGNPTFILKDGKKTWIVSNGQVFDMEDIIERL